MSLDWEIILSTIAVSISAYSFLSSRKLTLEINKQQLQINELLLTKEKEYFEEKSKAKFRAFILNQGNHFQINITNQGKANARNLHLEIIIDERYKGDFYNIDKLLPMNLNTGQTTKIGYARRIDFPNKFAILLTWDDEYRKGNKEQIELTS